MDFDPHTYDNQMSVDMLCDVISSTHITTEISEISQIQDLRFPDLRVTFRSTELLKSLLTYARQLTDSIALKFDAFGLRAQVTNACNICLLHIEIPSNDDVIFHTYDISTSISQSICIMVNINHLQCALLWNGQVTLEYIKVTGQPQTLGVQCQAVKYTSIIRIHIESIPCSADLDLETLHYPLSVTINAKSFATVAKSLCEIAAVVCVYIEMDRLIMEGHDFHGDIGETRVVMISDVSNVTIDDAFNVVDTCFTSHKTLYKIQHIIDMVQASHLSDSLTLKMAFQAVPLYAEYKIGKCSHVQYFIAPLVFEDIDDDTNIM